MENKIQTTWKDIPGFEGFYEINIIGEVKGKQRIIKRQKGITTINPKFLTSRINNCGYMEVRLSKHGKTHTKFIHNLLGQTFIPNLENKPQINHKNGIKLDNRLSNLEWVTHSENMRHAYENNLCKKINKPVIDTCDNHEYDNAKEAAKQCGINYFTLRNYLNGSRNNPTCLQYKQAA